jgi:hypothetical protein
LKLFGFNGGPMARVGEELEIGEFTQKLGGAYQFTDVKL